MHDCLGDLCDAKRSTGRINFLPKTDFTSIQAWGEGFRFLSEPPPRQIGTIHGELWIWGSEPPPNCNFSLRPFYFKIKPHPTYFKIFVGAWIDAQIIYSIFLFDDEYYCVCLLNVKLSNQMFVCTKLVQKMSITKALTQNTQILDWTLLTPQLRWQFYYWLMLACTFCTRAKSQHKEYLTISNF